MTRACGRTVRRTGKAIAAALLCVLLALPGPAAATPETDPGKLVESYRQLASERQRMLQALERNLALKRSIEDQYATLAVDLSQFRRDAAVATELCSGRFDEPEYRRRKDMCAIMQAELDARHDALERRKREIDARERERHDEAVRMKAAYDALEQRIKALGDAIGRAPALAAISARCRTQAETTAVSQCLHEGWSRAAETRAFVDLQTGDAFGDGSTVRRSIDAGAWPVLDKFEAMTATYLAELGRYRDAALIVQRIRAKHPSDPLLQSLEARLAGLAERVATAPAASPQIRTLAEELRIAHLPMQGRAAVLLALLAFREGDYDRSLNFLRDAEKSQPADAGIRDMIFLAEQARQTRAERGQPEAPTDRPARVMQREGALAATNLGFFLIEADNAVLTELALGEARERVAKIRSSMYWPPWSVPDLKLMDEMIAQVRSEGTAAMARGVRVTHRWTKAEFMLDALAYGQKSWPRSLRYLEIAMKADPNNPRVREAYDELSAIAASAK